MARPVPAHDPAEVTMTPTRAVVGLAAVAAAGYAAINGMSDRGPQYVGDFPSIEEQSQNRPPPVTHDPGALQPGDPQHYSANPVTPQAPPGSPRGPAGPGPVPPAAPPGGGGTGSEGGYPGPGAGTPLGDGLPSLSDLLSGLPTFDVQGFCRLSTGQLVALPCDQIPAPPAS
jgi:hypothetical protein